MKVGLRIKLVTLLAAIALLPLTAALLAIVIGGTRIRQRSVGRTIMLIASAEARELGNGLIKDIEKLHVALEESPVLAALAAVNEKMSGAELAKLDAQWPKMDLSSPRLAKVLKHPIADVLRLIQAGDPRIVELLVTDRFGQLAAATGRTTDFYQADESWWMEAYHGGNGRIVVMPVNYDRSASAWSLDVCLPLSTLDGRIVGVLKAVLEISGWIGSTSRDVEYGVASVMLVRRDGLIIFAEDVEPLETAAPDWAGAIAVGRSAGWAVTPSDRIRAFASIRLPDRIRAHEIKAPTWLLVLSLPRAQAMRSVYRLALTVLAIGLGIIAGLFLVGYWLINRSIVQRIRRLERATHQVGKGNLAHRIEFPRASRLLGSDEIDALARDFNRMVRQVGRSHTALQEANTLKANFIQIAGHELRTPVSYILATARLLRGCMDLERLNQALVSVGDKAERLNGIIRAMFKLMPDQRYGEQMSYGEVDVASVAKDISLDCRPFMERRGQKLIIEGADDLPLIQADRDKLFDIVENLVMNAVKFTPDGGALRVQIGMQLGSRISIAVVDQGPGISDGDLPYIFEPFYSTADVLKHSSGGTGYQKRGVGLGLAIVRRFTELHGGTVRVSTGPSGSTFTVILPIEPPVHPYRPGQPA